MNRRLLLIIGVVVALVVGGAVIFFILSNQAPPPAPVPSVTPVVQAPLTLTVTPSATTLNASASASFDIFLNTGGVKIDGFQFIANLDGAGVSVTDADPATAGVQIAPATVSGLNTVTNSVVPQGTAQVIRFAMITANAGAPFSSSTPVKVATVTFVPGTTGSIKLDFNTQNTRANKTGTTADTLITASSVTFTVNPALSAAPTTATTSAALASAKASPTPKPTTSVIACNAACLTDNDCSLGLSCINNSCLNAACPTSTRCSCTGTTSAALANAAIASPTPRTTALASASATPKATATPKAAVAPKVASIAALPKALPQSGSVENTLILVFSGLSLMVLAAVFMLRSL